MLRLSPDEIDTLSREMGGILEYVSQLSEVKVGEAAALEAGPLNVMRADAETVPPGSYTDAILAGAPKREGNHVVVKKIIAQ